MTGDINHCKGLRGDLCARCGRQPLLEDFSTVDCAQSIVEQRFGT